MVIIKNFNIPETLVIIMVTIYSVGAYNTSDQVTKSLVIATEPFCIERGHRSRRI